MRSILKTTVALLGLGIALSYPHDASGSDQSKHFTISGFGGYQTYDMSDVNRTMQDALATYSGARADKRELSGGAGFAAGIRVWPSDRVFVGLEFQRLLASNSGSGQYSGATYAVDLEVPASSIAMSAGYVPMPGRRVRFGAAVGGGYYVATGKIVTNGPGVNDRADLAGSGFGAHGMGIVLARLSGRLDVEMEAGYRYARTTDVTTNGNRYRNPDGSLAKIDWSGFFGRAGLTFWLGNR